MHGPIPKGIRYRDIRSKPLREDRVYSEAVARNAQCAHSGGWGRRPGQGGKGGRLEQEAIAVRYRRMQGCLEGLWGVPLLLSVQTSAQG